MSGFGQRRAGVLLHPTALTNEYGPLGSAARTFVDWLADAGFSVWQVLPLGPVDAHGSPYWSSSDHAFNPALIDWREVVPPEAAAAEFAAFCAQQSWWLEDYVLFAALAAEHGGAPWWQWPAALRQREAGALREAREALAQSLQRLRTEQWQAARQWQALKTYANERGVLLFGDVPIYVAPDSVATWSQPQQFLLGADGRPAKLAGVPPDYFAADGQLWGNPLYDWQRARRDGFAFWRARLRPLLQRFDWLRIDHFRGLESCWAVPAGSSHARDGEWLPVPGAKLLEVLRREYPSLPLVAEDLGIITPAVDALRERFGLPGMRVLQFGFDGSGDNPHLPHQLPRHCVAYTGTHDNDTTLGWYQQLDAVTRQQVDFVLRSDRIAMPEALLRAALFSVAELAVLPAQDLIGCGSEGRFNTPGRPDGNWRWRLPEGRLDAQLRDWLRALNAASGRSPRPADQPASSR